MILEKETALFNDGAIAALEELATGKSTVFYQASAPAVAGRKVNDIWFDTDDGNTMYRFNGTTWAKQQFGDAAIVAGSITAAKINTQDLYTNFLVTNILNAAQASISSLSAITANIGEVTAGVLKSANYAAPTSATGDYSAAGMLIDLTNGVIRTKNFAVLADGSAHINTSLTLGGANNVSGVLTVKAASGTPVGTWDKDGIWTIAGKIGGWDINSAQIRSDVTVGTTKYSAVMQSMDSSASTSRFAFAVVEYANGSTTFTDIPFRVNYDGSLLSTKGTIGGWTIGSSRLESTKTISGTIYNSYIQNMDGTDLTRGAFVLRNSTDGGTTWNYPFLVRYNGEGRIGAWNFNATALYKGSSSYGSRVTGNAYIGNDGISFGGKNMILGSTETYGAVSYLARNASYGIEIGTINDSAGRVKIEFHNYTTEHHGTGIEFIGSVYFGDGADVGGDLACFGDFECLGNMSVKGIDLYPQSIDNGANLNSFTYHGDFYYLAPSSGASIVNYPNGAVISNFTLQVMKKGDYCNQILINNSGEMYYRNQFTSSWSSWRKVTAVVV